MEVLKALSSTQLLFPAVAVAAVLICAALVFVLGFRSQVEPAYNKSPLLQEDRKQNKKRKFGAKDKKPSPNRMSGDSKTESTKKSPTKEKLKETQKPKERLTDIKIKVEKKAEEGKRGKTPKTLDEEKPVDFDEGDWEEVPKKEKKKPKVEEKKDSPAKNNKKKKESDTAKENKVETFDPENVVVVDEDVQGATDMDVQGAVDVDVKGAVDVDEVNRELREKINELQRVLKEAELRDNGLLPDPEPTAPGDIAADDKKKNKKYKKTAELVDASECVLRTDKENIPEPTEQEENQQTIVFDQLGDTKAPKKSKKKVRKE